MNRRSFIRRASSAILGVVASVYAPLLLAVASPNRIGTEWNTITVTLDCGAVYEARVKCDTMTIYIDWIRCYAPLDSGADTESMMHRAFEDLLDRANPDGCP